LLVLPHPHPASAPTPPALLTSSAPPSPQDASSSALAVYALVVMGALACLTSLKWAHRAFRVASPPPPQRPRKKRAANCQAAAEAALSTAAFSSTTSDSPYDVELNDAAKTAETDLARRLDQLEAHQLEAIGDGDGGDGGHGVSTEWWGGQNHPTYL